MRLVLSLIAFAVTTSASAQTLTMSGACPGPVTITVSGVTPGATVAFLGGAAGEGSDVVGIGRCAGAVSGLAGMRFLTRVTDADGDGTLTFTPTVPDARCDSPIQVLDTSSCTFSNVATAGGGGPDLGDVLFVGQGATGSKGYSDRRFWRVDLGTGAVVDVGPSERPLTGLSVGPDGQLWGVEARGRDFPDLVTIDPATGAQTYVSTSSDAGSMSGFAWRDGQLLGWTESGDQLGVFDPATGAFAITGPSNGTGGHCMATDASGRMIRLDRAEVFETAPDGTDIPLGTLSGMSGWVGHGCTFHNGVLYTHDSSLQLFTVDLVSLVATPTGIVLPEFTDALGSFTP